MSGFRGSSIQQSSKYADKDKTLKASLKFHKSLSTKIYFEKVNLKVLEPWINNNVTRILGAEDEVVVEYVMQLLNEGKDGKDVQIALMGFLEDGTPEFVVNLWKLLISAQSEPSGIPKEFLELKRIQLEKRKEGKQMIESKLTTGSRDRRDTQDGDIDVYAKRPIRSPRRSSPHRNRRRYSRSPRSSRQSRFTERSSEKSRGDSRSPRPRRRSRSSEVRSRRRGSTSPRTRRRSRSPETRNRTASRDSRAFWPKTRSRSPEVQRSASSGRGSRSPRPVRSRSPKFRVDVPTSQRGSSSPRRGRSRSTESCSSPDRKRVSSRSRSPISK